MSTDIKVPALGESVTEATIARWFKKEGEVVKADEPIVELETDKVTVEVPAPASGVLSAIAVNSGATVGVGAILGQIGKARVPPLRPGRRKPRRLPPRPWHLPLPKPLPPFARSRKKRRSTFPA